MPDRPIKNILDFPFDSCSARGYDDRCNGFLISLFHVTMCGGSGVVTGGFCVGRGTDDEMCANQCSSGEQIPFGQVGGVICADLHQESRVR